MTAAHHSLDDLYRQFGPPTRILISYFPEAVGATPTEVEISDEQLFGCSRRVRTTDAFLPSPQDAEEEMWSLPLSPEIRALARDSEV